MLRYNIVENDGERTSVTVFIDADALLATKDHPHFQQICAALEGGESDPEVIRPMFDIGVAVAAKFERLTERVTVAHGRIYFDGDVINSALGNAILRFHAEGHDFMPLCNFFEKIMQNPSEHSREHLFRWLGKHHFGIAPDGDFIAYKGVTQEMTSVSAGTAFVNGTTFKGRIPVKPDTIIEMPRSEVEFNPSRGCSTGLHAGNWRYAREFSQGHVLRVKINPRDVVSVPVDSNDEKLRVCRYRIVDVVSAQDEGVLFVPNGQERIARVPMAPAAQPPVAPRRKGKSAGQQGQNKMGVTSDPPKKSKPKPVTEFPEYYEDFMKRHFEACPLKELRWLAKEWEMQGTSQMKKDELVAALTKAAAKARRERKA